MPIARATWPSPTPPAPAWPTTSPSIPSCRRSSSTTSARTRILPQVPTYLGVRADDLAYIVEHIARAGGEDHRRLRRLRHAHGAVREQERERGVRGEGEEEPRATTSPSRSSSSPRIRPTSTATSSRGASTSGPSCSTAIACACCPAGSRGWPCATGRTWSTPRKEAAARTPGCWPPGRRLMLSRVADSLYWMGRYLERAEHITRLLLVTEDVSTETQGLDEDLAQTAWKDMLAIFPSAQLTREITRLRAPLGTLSPRVLHRPGEPVLDPLLAAQGARERALRARGPHRSRSS